MKRAALVLTALLMSQAAAAETASYSYDALGRLVNSTYVGGPRNGNQTTLNYDPAGNRTQYSYGGGQPPPPPMTALNPSDTLAGSSQNTFPPTKFEQNGVSPTIQSFAIPSGDGSAQIASGGASVTYTTPAAKVGSDSCTPGANQVFVIVAGVEDATGASVSSNYTVTVDGVVGKGVCR